MNTLEKVEREPVDRSGWAPGPWDNEADAYRWTSPTGLQCNIWRNRYGAWCGYAAVPETHPDHGADWSDVDYDVHYGVNFSSAVDIVGEYRLPWSFGFDCGHHRDLKPDETNPAHPFFDLTEPGEKYWTVNDVVAEVERLAAQIADGKSRRTGDRNILADVYREVVRDRQAEVAQ